MTRRDALLRLTALLGGTVFGAERFLTERMFAAAASPPVTFSASDLALLNEVAETIVPTTEDSAGAKAADVAGFMQEIARDYYDENERALLLSVPGRIAEASAARYGGRGFLTLDAGERYTLLLGLDRSMPQPGFYRMVKELTLWGYWTSEVGVKQALNYLPVPGMFQGCLTVEPTTRAWAG
jgi:hypothetical protein